MTDHTFRVNTERRDSSHIALGLAKPQALSRHLDCNPVGNTMLALPHVSGTECIEALTTHFGYRLKNRGAGLASLSLGANLVIVPENATLSPALVAAILRTAKVDPLDFISVIDTAPASQVA